ncbi:hypothetical protein GEMRC1_001110 [Eukaryota sp. GEM-RC1]
MILVFQNLNQSTDLAFDEQRSEVTPPAEEPTVSSLEALLRLNLSPELREQLTAGAEVLDTESAIEEEVEDETSHTTPHHPKDEPLPPTDFHLHISRNVRILVDLFLLLLLILNPN